MATDKRGRTTPPLRGLLKNPLSGGVFFHLLVGGHRFYPPDKGGQGGCFSSREGCPIYPLKSGLFQQPREESDCSFLSLAAPPSSVGADPPRISRRTNRSASATPPQGGSNSLPILGGYGTQGGSDFKLSKDSALSRRSTDFAWMEPAPVINSSSESREKVHGSVAG